MRPMNMKVDRNVDEKENFRGNLGQTESVSLIIIKLTSTPEAMLSRPRRSMKTSFVHVRNNALHRYHYDYGSGFLTNIGLSGTLKEDVHIYYDVCLSNLKNAHTQKHT